MELDTFLQILFGIIATLLTIFGIWFTLRYTQGKLPPLSSLYMLSPKSIVMSPKLSANLGREKSSRRSSIDGPPSYNRFDNSNHRYMLGRRRMVLIEDTIGHFPMNDWSYANDNYGSHRLSGSTNYQRR
jgi:hypothetical protein